MQNAHSKHSENLLFTASLLAEQMVADLEKKSLKAYTAALYLVEQGGFIEVAVQLDADCPRIRLNVCGVGGEKHTLSSVSLQKLDKPLLN